MIISECLKHLIPEAIEDKDYFVRNDGEGDYIAEWYLDTPEPSKTELEAKWKDIKGSIPLPSKDPMIELGEEMVQKDIKIMELESQNQSLGNQVVDHDIRLMIGGL